MSDVGHAFLSHSKALLVEDYLPKVEVCVRRLNDAALWWRPNDQSNAIGNLLLHLEGNVRQWILHGVGGAACTRDRQEEFAAAGGASRDELLDRLRSTCEEAGQVLDRLDERRLLDQRQIQGISISTIGAIYHAVEHFCGHLGQIVYITKMVLDEDLRFWVIGEDGSVQRGWTIR